AIHAPNLVAELHPEQQEPVLDNLVAEPLAELVPDPGVARRGVVAAEVHQQEVDLAIRGPGGRPPLDRVLAGGGELVERPRHPVADRESLLVGSRIDHRPQRDLLVEPGAVLDALDAAVGVAELDGGGPVGSRVVVEAVDLRRLRLLGLLAHHSPCSSAGASVWSPPPSEAPVEGLLKDWSCSSSWVSTMPFW